MNNNWLGELKQNKTDFKQFIKWFKETTEDSIKSTKELIDLDKMQSDYLTSHSTIYSLILRLRGIFLIKSILNNKNFSNSLFKKFITKYITESEFRIIYNTYRSVRDDKKIKNININIETANKLLDLLKKEVEDLDAK